MTERHFNAGELIFREGEESDRAYIIRTGKVEIFKRIEQGTVLLATLGPGEIFGEMGVFEDLPRTAYAAAVTPVLVQQVERQQFFALMSSQPEEVVMIVRVLMERLRDSNRKVTTLMNKQARFQLARGNEAPPLTRLMVVPLTAHLKERMPQGGVNTTTLPFRVGGLPKGEDPNPLDWNNLYVRDVDMAVFSRNHFAIQRNEQGVFISDRGSRSGTIVNETAIGGGREHYQAPLRFGDNIVIAGNEDSPYRFSIIWE